MKGANIKKELIPHPLIKSNTPQKTLAVEAYFDNRKANCLIILRAVKIFCMLQNYVVPSRKRLLGTINIEKKLEKKYI